MTERLPGILRGQFPLVLALAGLGGAAGGAAAQAVPPADSAAARPAVADSLRPLVSPLPAFFRSLLLPGWGQAVLDRKLTGGLFLAWEGVTLGMTLKAHQELQHIRRTEDTRDLPAGQRESALLRSKKAEREDWLVLLVFNHLFSGLEAYVSAHLWDFPEDLRLRALPAGPAGRPGVGVSIPLRLP